MVLMEDPKAKDRSLMARQKSLCNGQRTGSQCAYYWALRKKTDTVNPDAQRKGETIRYCTFDQAEVTFLGDGGSDMAVACTGYAPSNRQYAPEFEAFEPMTPEEIDELERKQTAGEPLPLPPEEPPVPGLPLNHFDERTPAPASAESPASTVWSMASVGDRTTLILGLALLGYSAIHLFVNR